MLATASLALLILTLSLLLSSAKAQTISRPPNSLPVQSASDDPQITGSSYSAAICTLSAILATESAGGHGIGPLTVRPDCMSMALQPHSTVSVNGQTLPSSGIVTIFEPSGSSSAVSISSAQPTTVPIASGSSSSVVASSSSAAPPRQANAGTTQRKPPSAAGWISRQNIGVLLFTTFALLAGVTYFLDELMTLLV
ncbi:uncharacterized protein UBRO_02949 [Ustilago bromivora]|uniref:Uncharacterized protein n=1 Tax=Ustilago bromivora TaxID=307758 RepID=A0A1K0H5G7_9BASI|nr:uncharacterized protein UBRO_02949 [Ustilago bromivora]SYW84352.1 uncharacterized protein UBRO2_05452 [Ustilago bromivora]